MYLINWHLVLNTIIDDDVNNIANENTYDIKHFPWRFLNSAINPYSRKVTTRNGIDVIITEHKKTKVWVRS